MKNIRFILLIAMGLMGCKTQQVVIIDADPNNGLEPGSCYFSFFQNEGEGTIKERPFVLEIVPPIYEDFDLKFSERELEKYSIGNGRYLIQKRKSHFKFILKEEDLSKFTTVKNPVGYMYCMAEVPSESFTLTKEKLKTKGYKLSKTKIVQQSKIIKRYVRKKPKQLKENQYYFEGGYWTKPQRAVAGHPGGSLILKIKKRLIELGYFLIEDNILTEKTREALRDFQKKNGLKVGQLDQATLQKLGVRQ